MKKIYTNTDWAEFFMLAVTSQKEDAKAWLVEYSRAHQDLRDADDEEHNIAIKEAVSFLESFAESWNDRILKQEVRCSRWDPSNPQFW